MILAFWAAAWALFAGLRLALIYWLDPQENNRIRLLGLVDYGVQYALWALLTPAIFRLSWTLPVTSENWPRRVPFHIAIGMGVVTATMLTMFFLHNLYAHPAGDGHSWNVHEVARELIFYGYHYHMLFYLGIVSTGFAFDFYHGLRRSEAEAASAQARLVEARLDALRMQLHPHFLFNTLNTVANLTHRDPPAARRVIARLSELLRRALESAREHEVTLQNELGFASSYLDIVRERFKDRITVEIAVESEALPALVPNLILQPILENAVEHGISLVREHGIISISARRVGSELRLQVSDNGPGLLGQSISEGIGLSNSRARLEQLYGAHGTLTISGETAGTTVHVSLPFRVAPLDSEA